MTHAGYLDVIFNPVVFRLAVNTLAEAISKDKEPLDINCLVCTGLSGTVMASAISFVTNIPLVIVRKEKNTHSNLRVEIGDGLEELKVAFIDDMICSGDTIKRVYHELLSTEFPFYFRKVYLYRDGATSYKLNVGSQGLLDLQVQSFCFT